MVPPSTKEDGTMLRALDPTDGQFIIAARDGCSDHGIPEAIEAILADTGCPRYRARAANLPLCTISGYDRESCVRQHLSPWASFLAPAQQQWDGVLQASASYESVVPQRHCEKGPTMTAEIGDLAPDFTLPSANNETIGLAQFRGQKYVILSFHVFNFTSG
jgi:hypothetical protein